MPSVKSLIEEVIMKKVLCCAKKRASRSILKIAKKRFLGQKVAVLCNRYQYRGILEEVTKDGVLLGNASCVEVSGACELDVPQTEDYVGGDVLVTKRMIELIYQPNWVFAPLLGEFAKVKKPLPKKSKRSKK